MAEASTLYQPAPEAPTEKPKRHRLRTMLLVIVALVLAIGIIATAANHFGTDYNSLSEADQETLSQYDAFLAQTKDAPAWKGYQLNDLPAMYSPNRGKSVPFSEVVSLIRNGDIDVSLIPSYVIYESGVVLCESMDLVGYDYQDALNNATPGNAKTLEQLAREAMQQS